jgi:diketogulonate reductase-like aldo/keto reductase
VFGSNFDPSKTHEIAPGVFMPYVNCGGVSSMPSNYSAFLELGGRGLDTALTYGVPTQTSVGEAVRASGLKREEIFVTTKIPCCPQAMVGSMCDAPYNGSVAEDVKADLKQLGLDYVDLMLLHWGCESMDETVKVYQQMESLVKPTAGGGRPVARAIGISNFNSTNVKALLGSGITVKPAINQCGFSIGNHNNTDDRNLGRDDATLKYCQDQGIAYEAYSPLGGLSKIDILNDADVKAIAAKHSVSAAQVALRWIVQQDALFVTAASNPEYLKEDLQVFSFTLTDQEMALLGSK